MNTPEHVTEDLSAYLDGELSPAERERVDAHVSACSPCRGMLDALRATIADLHGVAQPAVPQAVRASLHAALADERTRASVTPLRTRIALAVSGVAAAVVGLLAFSLNDGARPPAPAEAFATFSSTSGAGATTTGALGASVYDEGSALALLDEARATDKAAAAGGAEDESQVARGSIAAGCAEPAVERAGSGRELILERSGYFKGTRAQLFVFAPPPRYALWVLRAQDCAVLFTAQRP